MKNEEFNIDAPSYAKPICEFKGLLLWVVLVVEVDGVDGRCSADFAIWEVW